MVLYRYLCREIYLCLLAILSVLVSILLINILSSFLQGAASGRYSIDTVFSIVLLQLPALLTYILPFSFFLAILIALGRLYNDSEMTVMSACGLGLFKQSMVVLSLAAIVALFAGWLSCSVVPESTNAFNYVKLAARNNFQVARLIPHRFEDFGNNHVVYVRDVDHGSDRAKDVFIAVADKKRGVSGSPKWDIIKADAMGQSDRLSVPGHFLLLNQGVRTQISSDALNTTVSHFKQYGVNLLSGFFSKKYQHQLPLKEVIPGLSLPMLHKYIATNNQAAAQWQLRFAIPISILISSLIAVSLSHINPRGRRHLNFLPAILIYIIYATLIFLANGWIESGALSPRIGMWWVHAGMAFVMLLLFAYRIGWTRMMQLCGVR